ncbi:17435_t:CDS:2 [Dentiscutata erythropus]|uniref:17435_t:CDS:1 n=1 Tax=Dentiscutata erythropus TaxID=1348616 RepID=A0A9N9DBX8_9GLOM|nr:17435_t:CDS:2 [Dentiscutata erythropus]
MSSLKCQRLKSSLEFQDTNNIDFENSFYSSLYICLFFDKELCDAIDIFDKDDFENFLNNLEAGIDMAINSLDK